MAARLVAALAVALPPALALAQQAGGESVPGERRWAWLWAIAALAIVAALAATIFRRGRRGRLPPAPR